MDLLEISHGHGIKPGLYCAVIFLFVGYVATRARLWIEKLSWLFSGPQLLAKKYVSTMLFKGFKSIIGVDIECFRSPGYHSLYKRPSANMFWYRQRLTSKSSVKPRRRDYP